MPSSDGGGDASKWDPPKGVVNENGTFMLYTTDILVLMKYIWSGCLLATTRDEYALRMSFDWADVNSDVSNEINKMLSTYTEVKSHTTGFREQTYKEMVGLADKIYDFATTAGGESDDSYYVTMMKYLKEYYEELNGQKRKDKLDELKEAIVYFIKAQTAVIDTLLQLSTKVKKELSDFEATTRDDQQNLMGHRQALGKLLDGDKGEIKKLQNEIYNKTQELKEDQKEYDKDCTIRNTAPSYMWVFPWGTIAGATVIGVYTDKINKLREKMNEIKDLINNDNAKLQADIRLSADIKRMEMDLSKLISLINPAIKTIEKLEGCWEKVSGDLGGLEKLVSSQDVDNIPPWLVEKPMQKKIMHKWNDLAKYGEDNESAPFPMWQTSDFFEQWIGIARLRT
ncbi:hypothetical protein PRK78_001411 [Emydomyces testavorans]|uniref:Uncharacterized protein n=1 Tax=Emydomyces testavorans TaxID=2070801 RepID=A0AAF0IGU3_9EURO|nr:hypothetical protein PRK78_001411 [Emydomyces testavorans]